MVSCKSGLKDLQKSQSAPIKPAKMEWEKNSNPKDNDSSLGTPTCEKKYTNAPSLNPTPEIEMGIIITIQTRGTKIKYKCGEMLIHSDNPKSQIDKMPIT